jgi:hypothetical protein
MDTTYYQGCFLTRLSVSYHTQSLASCRTGSIQSDNRPMYQKQFLHLEFRQSKNSKIK